ncbi:DUF6048 family protein [Chryseolinea lacunae]|uniref:DUF481 domain-containing protein n=1 Tax=Chryseolinea lacunae TaxID=2801331 RepID=A0ABS1KQP1_9BACT|nr:DUF6048 family protein [Chryseolinea lacunae]MBL0741557.1 hypothetical protein [Chryseolinea lacunae]
MKSIYNIALLVALALPAFGQKKAEKDTVTVKPSFVPTGVRIGTDVIALAKTSYDKTFNGWEMNADVDFNRYYFAVDVGSWGRKYAADSANYSNTGRYFRVGADVNFLKKDPDKNMFFLGLRYGNATFSENMSVIRHDQQWGNLSGSYENNNIRAHWLELTTGLRVKMWKMIWMGYTARFKFGLGTSSTPVMLPHDVPGYGRTDKTSYWGFNYQIFVRIPVRKSPAVPAEK